MARGAIHPVSAPTGPPTTTPTAHSARAEALREMRALSIMSLARRLRVSLPLALLAATVLLSCHTLAPLQQSVTDDEDADFLPRVLLQVWLPCSHLFGPLLLLALRPCDRLGTLWAAIVFAAICAYAIATQIVFWPTATHGFNSTRAVLLLLSELFWGGLFLRCGPMQALRSMWRRHVRWALNPRAALEGLWWTWRGSTISLAGIDAALALAAVIYQQVESTPEPEAEPEAKAEAEAEPEAEAEAGPESEAESEAEPKAEAEAEPEAEPEAEAEAEPPQTHSEEVAAEPEAAAEATVAEAADESQLCTTCTCSTPEPAAEGEAKAAEGEAEAAGEAAAKSEATAVVEPSVAGLEIEVALKVPCSCLCPPAPTPSESLAIPESTGEPGPRLNLPMAELVTSLTLNTLVLLIALLLGPGTRRYLRRLLTRLNGSPEAQSASVISAFIGSESAGLKSSAKELRAFARHNLRGLPFDQLRVEDLRHARQHTGRDEGDMLALHSYQCGLDEVDAFVSHAWGDDFELRYDALRGWATQFELENGRWPVIWLDKGCILQSSIEESLKCLPIFLAHCERLVVLGGPLWPTRLWCIIELFTFLRVGGNANAIVFLPLYRKNSATNSSSECQAANLQADSDMCNSMKEFDVRKAYCYDADRDLLLGAIESGYSTLDRFNGEMRKALAVALRTARSWAGTNERQGKALPSFRRVACTASAALWLRRQSDSPETSPERKPAPTHAPVKLLWQDVMKTAWDDLQAESGPGDETPEIVDFSPVGTPPLPTLTLVPASAAPSPSASASALRLNASLRSERKPRGSRERMLEMCRVVF